MQVEVPAEMWQQVFNHLESAELSSLTITLAGSTVHRWVLERLEPVEFTDFMLMLDSTEE